MRIEQRRIASFQSSSKPVVRGGLRRREIFLKHIRVLRCVNIEIPDAYLHRGRCGDRDRRFFLCIRVQGIPAGLFANLCGSHALEAFHRNAEALKRLEEIQKIVINQKVDACLRGRGAVGSARSTRGTKRPSEVLKAAYLKKSESLSR